MVTFTDLDYKLKTFYYRKGKINTFNDYYLMIL